MTSEQARLPKKTGFTDFELIRLDRAGRIIDNLGNPVVGAEAERFLTRTLDPPPECTDIFVFVHGWRTALRTAAASCARFFGAVATLGGQESYWSSSGGEFNPFFVGVHWPSASLPTPRGYRKVRDVAHAMTTDGSAMIIIAAILGYLDEHRTPPERGPHLLKTRKGQYLHCIGHSFGGRFLTEAIKEAAEEGPATLGWPWRNERPFGVDSLLVFQMAAPPDIFDRTMAEIFDRGALHGPIVLTHSKFDRANAVWHRVMEGTAGIGAYGVRSPAGEVSSIKLRSLSETYTPQDFLTQVVNVDSSALYRRRHLRFEGAHSDYWRPESIHLLLSLCALSR